MREHDMRLRIESMLRKTAVPAGVGISMALAGCSSDSVTPEYMALCPMDAGCGPWYSDAATPDSPTATPLYMAVMPDAGAKDSAADANDAAPTDAKSVDDTTPPFPIYMAMIPDPGVEGDGG
jgi:hypothetical protein